MVRSLKFIKTNSNLNIREYVGSLCRIRDGVWRLTPDFIKFMEQLVVDSQGKITSVRVEVLRDKDVVAWFSDV